MKPDLDSLISKARAQQVAAKALDETFNQHVWRRIRMSGDLQRRQRWGSGMLLSGPACGIWCLAVAVFIGAGFGWWEATRPPEVKLGHTDWSVFSARSPSLPSSLLQRP